MSEREKDSSTPSSRRCFLRLGAGLLASAATAGPLLATTHMLHSSAAGGKEGVEKLGGLGQFKIGTLTWLQELEIFVLRTPQGLGAFSSRCTHLGCTVKRTAAGFACPCHGAAYDVQGRVTAGPARKPLPWYRVIVAGDGSLWLDRGQVVENGQLTELSQDT